MTPERLAGWLKHRPAGAVRVQIVADAIGGLVVLADWERSELEAMDAPEVEVSAAMVGQAQEYTDAEGEKQKFLVRWIGGADRPMKVTTHRCAPTPPEEEGAPDSDSVKRFSDQLVQSNREYHKTILDMAKQIVASTSTMQAAYERTIAMQGAQNETLHKLLQERIVAPAAVEVPPEAREESIQRAKALEAFTGKIPEVMDLALAAVASKMLPKGDGGLQ